MHVCIGKHNMYALCDTLYANIYSYHEWNLKIMDSLRPVILSVIGLIVLKDISL